METKYGASKWCREGKHKTYVYTDGSYKGVIKREAVYKCTNKDYFPEAKPRVNDHFTCEAKPSKGKMYCQRA